MNKLGGTSNKKKPEAEAKEVPMSWQEKKELAQKEEAVLRKDIEDFQTWVDLVETMDDQQLKGYLENHPEDLKMTKGQKMKNKLFSISLGNGYILLVLKNEEYYQHTLTID